MKLKKVLPITAMLIIEEMTGFWNRVWSYFPTNKIQSQKKINGIKIMKEGAQVDSLFSISLN